MPRPNPVRTLESHAVVDQTTADEDARFCLPEKHYMRSIKTKSDLVPYVEQCATCLWVDPASLTWWAEDAVKKAGTARGQRIALATETEPFAFVQQQGEELTIFEMVYQALGAASMCWENPAGAGIFDSSRAKAIGERLMAEIERAMERSRERGAAAAREEAG